MSTLGEILDDIYTLYPHAMTDAQVTRFLNYEQREIFKEMQIKDSETFTTTEDIETYPLPSNCKIEDIISLKITTDTTVTKNSHFRDYEFAEINDKLSGYKYYDAFDGTFGIYPVPSGTGWNGTIIFNKRPTALDSTNQSATPDLNEDWHRIFVYAGIIEIAGAGPNQDIETVNNYTAKYNALMKDIKQSRYEKMPKYASTKDVMRRARDNYGSRREEDEVVINV
jgi:hypothetical protein